MKLSAMKEKLQIIVKRQNTRETCAKKAKEILTNLCLAINELGALDTELHVDDDEHDPWVKLGTLMRTGSQKFTAQLVGEGSTFHVDGFFFPANPDYERDEHSFEFSSEEDMTTEDMEETLYRIQKYTQDLARVTE